jgi:hypothetical protein
MTMADKIIFTILFFVGSFLFALLGEGILHIVLWLIRLSTRKKRARYAKYGKVYKTKFEQWLEYEI